MNVDWKRELLDQLDYDWNTMFRPKMNGLTDDEFFWEPVANCWSVRIDSNGLATMQIRYPDPVPSPFTTIAWRICHLASVYAIRTSNHFGDGSVKMSNIIWPESAERGLEMLDSNFALWRSHIGALTDEELGTPCGPAEGRFADSPFATLILHINRETIHHGGELCLLRDLWRNRATLTPG